MSLSYQPLYITTTDPAWDIPLITDSAADDISTLNINNFTMTFRTVAGVDTAGTGQFSVKNNSPAEVYYQPSASDVAASFTGYLIIKALTGDGRTRVWDPIAGINNGPFVISSI